MLDIIILPKIFQIGFFYRARSDQEGKHEDKLETIQSDNKSNDIVTSESTPNSSQGKHSKRIDSYEDPEAVFI